MRFFFNFDLIACNEISYCVQLLRLFIFTFFSNFYQYMDDLLSMGPPVYFVVTSGLNYSKIEVQNAICGGPQCNTDSLYTQLFSAADQSSE